MKKILILLTLFTVTFVNSQTTINKVLPNFSTLKVYNGIDVEIVKSDKSAIEITGPKAEKVKIKEENGVLKIALRFPETMAEGDVKATLFYKKPIMVIDANEGATITGKEISQSKVDIKAQEGAFINLVINTSHCYVKASSGGVIKLSGTTKNQDVNVDLGSTYHGFKLEVTNVSMIKAASGAKAEVLSNETLDAKVSFGGTIFYKGSPKVLKEKKVIGGTIEQRN